MEENILFWEFLLVISFVPARNDLFKVSNLSTRIRCESSSKLRMSMLTMLTWFILKRQIFLKARSGISYVIYYFVHEQNLLKKVFELIPSNPYGLISEKFLRRSLLQTLMLAKKMQLSFEMACCMYIGLFTDFAC